MITLILAIAAGPLLLLIWSLTYSSQCWALGLPLIIILVATVAARDRIRHRRQCLANCYFVRDSLLHRLLCSTTIITVTSVVIATILTVILLSSTPGWSIEMLALLAVDSIVIAMLYFSLLHAADGVFQVNQGFRSIFARNWAVAINVPVVVIVLLLLQLREPPPDYLDPSLDLATTMQAASNELNSKCRIIDTLIRTQQEAEAFSWWLMIRSSAVIEDGHLRWAVWLFFLLSGALGLLAYSRFCVQLIHYAGQFGNRR